MDWRSWRARALGAVFACLVLVGGPGVAVRAAESGHAPVRFVKATGHSLSGPFARFLRFTDADLLGAPLSEPMPLDGKLVQWFERGRLDMWPDGRMQLAPLGRVLGPPTIPPGPYGISPTLRGFPRTTPAARVIDAWVQGHGGITLFGPPLGPADGNSQWYERARLDYDPDNNTVTLGQVGLDAMQKIGLSPDMVQIHWLSAETPTLLRSAPALRAPASVFPAGVPVIQTQALAGWTQVWDPLLDRRGWLPTAQLADSDPPKWLSTVDQLTPLDTRARVMKWNKGWKFNAQVPIIAAGEAADGAQWYVDADGDLVPADLLRVPREVGSFRTGRWIDADLKVPVMITAYEDDHPVYSALAVKGTSNAPTRVGEFEIWRRVASETMDSSTIGIPLGRPGSYHLTGVLFTQYFTHDGAALHYNYWRSNWGYTGSHGCLGMNYEDSKWFWDWATIGVPVITRT
jgi:hypothetical protein